METYGEFEAFEEFHRGALSSVWKARRRGAGGEVFAVKVCRPSPWAAEGAEATHMLADMAECVRDLQTLSDGGAEYWTPVLASGKTLDEAWWVTRFHPRSVERVLAGRAQLTASDLQWVVLSVVRGMRELEAILQRPHGNLKPGNVFIGGAGRLRGAPAFLSDLKPRNQLSEIDDRTADFHTLGRMIVHLARRQHTNLGAAIGWPLEPGPEWRRLGKAEGWRALCNVLLNPHPARGEHDWAAIEERLRHLKGGRSPVANILIYGAPAAVLALGVGGWAWLRFAPYESLPAGLQSLAETFGNTPPDVAEVPPEWAELCLAYYNWAGGFLAVADDSMKSAAWRRDPYLSERVLAPLAAAKNRFRSLDPRVLARSEGGASVGGDLQNLAVNPPEVVKKGLVARSVVESAKAVREASEAYLQWPDRQRLGDLAKRFREIGLTGPAAEFQRVFDAGASGELTADAINIILRSVEGSSRAEGLWTDLDQQMKSLAATGDPVMAGVRGYVESRVSTAQDVPALNEALADAGREVASLQAWWNPPGGAAVFDKARYGAEGALRDFSGTVTRDVLEQWRRDIESFSFVSGADDPRHDATYWGGLLRGIDSSIAAIRDEQRTVTEAKAAADDLQAQRTAAQAAVDALLARRIVRRDVSGITADITALEGRIAELTRVAREALMRISPKPTEWLAMVRETVMGPAGSVVQQEWTRRRDQAIAGANAASLERDKAGFRDLRVRYMALEGFFRAFAGKDGVGRLAAFDETGIDAAVAPALREWAAGQSEKAVASWLQAVPWRDGVPEPSPDAFLASASSSDVLQRHAQALARATEVGRILSVVVARVDQGYGLDDDAVASAMRVRTDPVVAEIKRTPAIGQIVQVLDALESTSAETSADALVRSAGSPRLGLAISAWRGLGRLAAWPTPAQLDQESGIGKALRAQIQNVVADAGRRRSLLDEMDRERARRWRVALRAAADESVLGQVLGRRDEFGVQLSDLDPGERFNAEIYAVKRESWGTLDDAAAARERDAAVARLRPIVDALPESQRTGLVSWLQSLADLPLAGDNGAQSDVRKLGPGAVAWTGELPGDMRRVVFRWKSPRTEYQLEFVLVEADGVVPFYLCTTEMPVGLVLDLAANAEVGNRLSRWLSAALDEGEDVRIGPQVWRIDPSRRLRMSGSWTGSTLPTWTNLPPNQFYAPDLPDPGLPARTTPMQYIAPQAALYVARDVLGCRLPTTEEWKGLVAAGIARRAGANVRDRVWQRERDYLADYGVAPEQSPIDADVFWPRTAGMAQRGRAARVVDADSSDGSLWFRPVDSASGDTWRDLIGNVAEYLVDDDGGTPRFYVAGGSALASPEIDPTMPYPVETAFATIGYSDVGFRLAFDAPGSVTARNRLVHLIRARSYLSF